MQVGYSNHPRLNPSGKELWMTSDPRQHPHSLSIRLGRWLTATATGWLGISGLVVLVAAIVIILAR